MSGVEIILDDLKDFNQWSSELSGSAKQIQHDESADGRSLYISLTNIKTATDQRIQREIGPSSFSKEDSQKVNEAFKEHVGIWSDTMSAFKDAASTIKRNDAAKAREIHNLLKEIEDAFRKYSDRVQNLVDDQAKKSLEEMTQKSGKAAKAALEAWE